MPRCRLPFLGNPTARLGQDPDASEVQMRSDRVGNDQAGLPPFLSVCATRPLLLLGFLSPTLPKPSAEALGPLGVQHWLQES